MEKEYYDTIDIILMNPIEILLPLIIILALLGISIWLSIRKIRIRLFQMKRYEEEMKAYKEWSKAKKREEKTRKEKL